MIRNFLFPAVGTVAVSLILSGCGPKPVSYSLLDFNTPTVAKTTDLSEAESQSWGHADLILDTIPGMSVNRAYSEIIDDKGKTVIVAVVDSGIDLEHEDLNDVIWTNEDEIPGNGKDDDQNGYVDDVHGYNFLGEAYHEQLEAARIIRLSLGDAKLQARAKSVLDKDAAEAASNKQRYEQILSAVEGADAAVKAYLGSESAYTPEQVMAVQTDNPELQQHVSVIRQMFNFDDSIDGVISQLRDGISYFSDRLNYHFNVAFDGRAPVGDDPYNLNNRDYGNGDPKNRVLDESHGTHVAGIIAAERNNGIGVNGVADNVKIMAIRAVPDGDEYDKDIALAIRYAVDNGARIINASFGKPFSPNSEWVKEALAYAAKKDVLFVHAAGNDALDLDDPENENYPTDQVANGAEFTDNVLTVGSLDSSYGSNMVSSFSNFGATGVDIFAPGGQIYSTMPGSAYEFQGGTSMAAPAVSGIAAMIRSRFPNLTATQVKQIIMSSGIFISTTVVIGGDPENTRTLNQVSRTGRIANLYNAMVLAGQVDRGSVKL